MLHLIVLIQICLLLPHHIIDSTELNRKVLDSLYGFTLSYASSLNLCCKEFTTIHNNTFTGLANVQILVLAANHLTRLDSSTFTGLTSLTKLELYSNNLTRLEADTFSALTKLQTLSLHMNQLTAIDRQVFIGLINLNAVYLRSNPISTILPSYVTKLCSTNPKCTIYL